MIWLLDAQNTYLILLVTQAAHLFHHRIVKRHISFAEVVSGAVLCIQPHSFPEIASHLPFVHLALVGVQVVGSLFIQKLSPNWDTKRISTANKEGAND